MTLTHTQDFFERNDSSIRILGKIKITICQDFTAGCKQVAKNKRILKFSTFTSGLLPNLAKS